MTLEQKLKHNKKELKDNYEKLGDIQEKIDYLTETISTDILSTEQGQLFKESIKDKSIYNKRSFKLSARYSDKRGQIIVLMISRRNNKPSLIDFANIEIYPTQKKYLKQDKHKWCEDLIQLTHLKNYEGIAKYE